jgi:hypothetical protein
MVAIDGSELMAASVGAGPNLLSDSDKEDEMVCLRMEVEDGRRMEEVVVVVLGGCGGGDEDTMFPPALLNAIQEGCWSRARTRTRFLLTILWSSYMLLALRVHYPDVVLLFMYAASKLRRYILTLAWPPLSDLRILFHIQIGGL